MLNSLTAPPIESWDSLGNALAKKKKTQQNFIFKSTMNISLWSHIGCSLLWLLLHRSPQSCSLFPTSNAWEQQGINRISVGVNMLSHLFLSFIPLVLAPSEVFPLMAFQFSWKAAHHPRQWSIQLDPSPPTALLTQGLETYSETPTTGFDGVGTILSLLFCKPRWLMKYITFSASALCFLCPIWSNCLLLNELDEKYVIGDLDPSFTKFGEDISAEVLAKS